MNMVSSFISFRGHIISFLVFFLLCLSNLYNHSHSSYDTHNQIPVNNVLINFISIFLSLIFVFQKSEVLAFLRRRIKAKIDALDFKFFKKNKINPMLPQSQ